MRSRISFILPRLPFPDSHFCLQKFHSSGPFQPKPPSLLTPFTQRLPLRSASNTQSKPGLHFETVKICAFSLFQVGDLRSDCVLTGLGRGKQSGASRRNGSSVVSLTPAG